MDNVVQLGQERGGGRGGFELMHSWRASTCGGIYVYTFAFLQ